MKAPVPRSGQEGREDADPGLVKISTRSCGSTRPYRDRSHVLKGMQRWSVPVVLGPHEAVGTVMECRCRNDYGQRGRSCWAASRHAAGAATAWKLHRARMRVRWVLGIKLTGCSK